MCENLWIVNCILVFALCGSLAGIIIPQILLIAFRRQLFDEPNERKIHHCAVPRLGGIAFKPVVFFSISLLLGINLMSGHTEILFEIGKNVQPLAFGFCAIMFLYFVGMADDLIGVRYRVKFIIQIMCGMMLIAGGIWMNDLHGVLWLHGIPIWLGYPLTVLVTVFIINAINLIDGIDGLASGLCSIAFIFYGITFCIFHLYFYALLAFAFLGVLVPFFYYNVFGNTEKGQKIFMGDTGSLTIGMMLCILSIRLSVCIPEENLDMPNPIVLAFSPLVVPCCDVVRVYIHRIRSGKNPFLPDQNHIHHKLLALGMRQRIAMIIIVSSSFVLSLLNILMAFYINVNYIFVLDILIWTSVNIWLTKKIMNKQPD